MVELATGGSTCQIWTSPSPPALAKYSLVFGARANAVTNPTWQGHRTVRPLSQFMRTSSPDEHPQTAVTPRDSGSATGTTGGRSLTQRGFGTIELWIKREVEPRWS